jgi:hypothetical protein
MFGADYVHISSLWKSWLLHLSLNIVYTLGVWRCKQTEAPAGLLWLVLFFNGPCVRVYIHFCSWPCVRIYTHLCWNSVRESFISSSFTSFVFHNTDTFYLPSPLALALSVAINTNGVETVAFRHAGKSQEKIGAAGPICWRFSRKRSDWWAPEARFF